MNAQGTAYRRPVQSILERKPAGMLRSCVRSAIKDVGRRAYRTHRLRSPAVAFADGWIDSQPVSTSSGSAAYTYIFHHVLASCHERRDIKLATYMPALLLFLVVVLDSCGLLLLYLRRTGEFKPSRGNEEKYSALSVRELQLLLDTAGIDYRDCFDKQDLVDRLKDNAGTSQFYAQVCSEAVIIVKRWIVSIIRRLVCISVGFYCSNRTWSCVVEWI